MAAAVGVDDRALAGRERRAGRQQARVGEPGRRPRPGGPRDGPAVEAVDDGRQVDPAGVAGQAELRDVGDPEPVRGGGREGVPAVAP